MGCFEGACIYRYFFEVKVKTVKLIGGRGFLAVRSGLNACPNHTDDGIHSDHGYLDTLQDHLNNSLGPNR